MDALLFVWQEELQHRPKISTLLSSLVRYDPVQPNPSSKTAKKKKKARKGREGGREGEGEGLASFDTSIY